MRVNILLLGFIILTVHHQSLIAATKPADHIFVSAKFTSCTGGPYIIGYGEVNDAGEVRIYGINIAIKVVGLDTKEIESEIADTIATMSGNLPSSIVVQIFPSAQVDTAVETMRQLLENRSQGCQLLFKNSFRKKSVEKDHIDPLDLPSIPLEQLA